MSSGGLGPDISQEELDFDDLFLYNTPGQHQLSVGCDKDDPVAFCPNVDHTPLLVVEHDFTSNQPASSQTLSFHSQPIEENLSGAMFESLGLVSGPGGIPAPSPRIEITPSGDSLTSQTLEPKVFGAYRECVSPASSNSSTGWPADSYSPVASPCVSPSHGGGCSTTLSALDLCPGLQSIQASSSTHSSPGASPRNSITDESFLLPQQQHATAPLPQRRSRSISPHGKRAYDQVGRCPEGIPVKQRSRSPSPNPSPHEQQGSHYLQQYQANPQFQTQLQISASTGLEKDWNSTQSRTVPIVMVQNAHAPALTQDCVYEEVYDWALQQERIVRSGAEGKSDIYYVVPPVLAPPEPVHYGTFSCHSVAPLPAFERPLPSQCGPCELLILQQPRSHHRAHYETEGSRGAVKTSKEGHPEVQLRGYHGSAPLMLQVFIGTADERLLKPHAFYQVHRITGKTVTTRNVERIINGVKVLEIPLEPTHHMRVVIDCVGILKLKNADIELKNGETDIGRKNTRVRLVFRVHIPQSGGQIMSLQVASDPIECSQRSAQEVPAVERQDVDRCSVLGGQQIVLTGQNFTQDSRVIFSEKTQDGKQIWEVEATVNKDKTQANMLFVEVPPYPDKTICHSVKVNFYVINGKKKRSQPQHFTYTPMIVVKAEPLDDHWSNTYGSSDNWSLSGLPVKSIYPNNIPQALSVSPTLSHLTTIDPAAYSMSTLDSLDDQAAYYQNRPNSLINGPMLYHAANQHYSSCGTALPAVFPITSRSVGIKNSADKMAGSRQVADSFESRLTSRQQTTLPLGKSPYSTFNQGQVQDTAACRGEAVGRTHEEWAAEKVTLKQENLSYTYLEDVNDIIRRDVKGHSEE